MWDYLDGAFKFVTTLFLKTDHRFPRFEDCPFEDNIHFSLLGSRTIGGIVSVVDSLPRSSEVKCYSICLITSALYFTDQLLCPKIIPVPSVCVSIGYLRFPSISDLFTEQQKLSTNRRQVIAS